MMRLAALLAVGVLALWPARAAQAAATDQIPTSGGPLTIGFVGHGSIWFEYQGKVIQVDPYSKVGDYAALPKGDLVLITHGHRDHLDADALALAGKPGAKVIASSAVEGKVPGAVILKNGDKTEALGIAIEAVPAYNLVHKRPEGAPFHPKGEGNGYVLTFGDKKVYVGGDTEDVPEMANLAGVDVAFIPVNLPYTMTPEMAVHAAKMLKAKILYPYHTGETDMVKLEAMLKEAPGTEVRIRPMK